MHFSREAEEQVIGSVLVDRSCLNDVKAILQPADFDLDSTRLVFQAMLALDGGLDQFTLTEELRKRGDLAKVGGAGYLSGVVARTTTSVNACHYADIVKQYSYERQLIAAGGKIVGIGHQGQGDRQEKHRLALEALKKIEPRAEGQMVGPERHSREMATMLDEITCPQRQPIGFGYRDLNWVTGGMHGGELCLLGGRPGTAKTQVLLEVALHNAKLGHAVLLASAEMGLHQLMQREIAMGVGIDMRELRRGTLSEPDLMRSRRLAEKASDLPLYFLTGNISAEVIAEHARTLKEAKGLKLVLVDYLQILSDKANRRAGDTIRERIAYISAVLKNTAVELDTPILAASQLNREVEARDDHLPRLSDLREAGDLEQDADLVLLLHRPELYEKSKAKHKGLLLVKVAKHRQLGVSAVVELVWVEKEHRYADLAKTEEPMK